MLSLELTEGLGIFLLGLKKIVVPLLVKLVVLLDMSLFTLLSLLGLIKEQFISLSLVILILELSNSILGHFCLYVLAFNFTSVSVLLKNLATE
jgi:hypothetical protein